MERRLDVLQDEILVDTKRMGERAFDDWSACKLNGNCRASAFGSWSVSTTTVD